MNRVPDRSRFTRVGLYNRIPSWLLGFEPLLTETVHASFLADRNPGPGEECTRDLASDWNRFVRGFVNAS